MVLDVFALVATLFLGLGLGGVCVAVFMYVIERMQNGGDDDSR
jgi:Flp pilus assembly protein TadG